MPEFLKELDEDLRKIVIAQLRNLWTHTSTAIEGNTLTLGETAFVLEEGLTVSGKPLKDHQEVFGHAKAIDLIYDIVNRTTDIIEQDLFLLHKAVQTEFVLDVYKPVGNWKVEPNYTSVTNGEKQIIFEYANPKDVPVLMKQWLALLNSYMKQTLSKEQAMDGYIKLHISFVRIHPFFDGNGRMARLVSNIPVLKSGFPPIIIPKERRREYIMALTEYHIKAGVPLPGLPLIPEIPVLEIFKTFCSDSWRETIELIEAAKKKQTERKLK